ncbi:hypothetical protein V2G26_012442 [Clonostachys chloroleuca]
MKPSAEIDTIGFESRPVEIGSPVAVGGWCAFSRQGGDEGQSKLSEPHGLAFYVLETCVFEDRGSVVGRIAFIPISSDFH